MKLIKINEDHYVVVNDSPIEVGDFVAEKLLTGNYDVFQIDTLNDIDVATQKKITHSTRSSLENIYKQSPINLSLQEVKELLGIADVEKKVSEHFKNYWTKEDGTEMSRDEITADMMTNMLMETSAYNAGYNQALEDNKHKKFTEEDLKAILTLFQVQQFEQSIDEIVASFSRQKREWEVEFIDGKLNLI